MSVTHLNPEGLYTNPSFTQVVVTEDRDLRTVRVAGQAPVDSAGQVVGKGDLAAQAERVFENVRIGLQAAGADLSHVIRWTFYLVAGQPAGPAVSAYQEVWAGRPNPPMVTLLYVAGLAHPEYLFEVETLAVVPKA